MMFPIFDVFVPLLALVSVASSWTPICIDATYDDIDLPTTGSILGNPPTNPYKYLNYTSFDVYGAVAPGTTPVIGVETHSPPQGILTTSTTQLTTGDPSIEVAETYYQLTLKSFYFGCSDNTEEGGADEATTCTVTAKGYNEANAEVASAPFTFTVPTVDLTKEPEIEAVLPSSFTNLYKVVFLLDDYATKVLLIDNLSYCIKD